MVSIIPPVDKALLEAELTTDKFVRKTNNGNNLIYIFDHHDSPNLMQEIGRLREITFRDSGGGTGLEVDIDEFFTTESDKSLGIDPPAHVNCRCWTDYTTEINE